MAKIDNKKRTIVARNDPEFVREMKELAKFRYMKNLETREPNLKEMQEISMKTNSWANVKFELKTKPRKDRLK